MSRIPSLLFVLVLPVAIGGSVLAADLILPAAERSGLGLTLYQGDIALVRDRRPASLERGGNSLSLDGVSRAIRPGSAMLQGSGVTITERGTDSRPLSAERLLAANLGRQVTLYWPGEPATRGRVLSVEGMPLFEVDGKVMAGTPDRIVYDGLPPGLTPRPSFHARLNAESGGPHELDLTYLTGGLGWSADATGELDGDRMSLTVWANLGNSSGADFPDATLRLVAGTFNQAGDFGPRLMAGPARAATEPLREIAGPYHVYTIAEPITLKDGENRQIPLLASTQVKVHRQLVLEPLPPASLQSRTPEPRRQHPMLVVDFTNTAKNGLGKPLPAATIRITERGPGGEIMLLGEDRLEALPEGAEARLTLGEAFDVTATRVQTDFQKIAADVSESAWEVRLSNGGDRAAVVTVREAFHSDWLVIDENAPHVKDSAGSTHWTVTAPPKGQALLRYRVRVKG
ncbi:MAG: DUF4139 domain-containing protein [Magnetospirillum sp.]|nr:DUF4139 domain-containing protein [Magnetospirillum sp.]